MLNDLKFFDICVAIISSENGEFRVDSISQSMRYDYPKTLNH